MSSAAVVHYVAGRWSGGVACGHHSVTASSKDAHIVSCERCRSTAEFHMVNEDKSM